MDPQLTELGVRLAESAARNTAASIATRIRTARSARQDRDAIVELQEIITELSEDRSELLQIAQAYREQLVGQTISTGDVEYITSQLIPKLTHLFDLSSGAGTMDANTQEMIDIVKALVSNEMITILQLLGFSFKRAIGEPLTELVSHAISSRVADPRSSSDVQRMVIERDLALIALAQNAEAYDRFKALTGGG